MKHFLNRLGILLLTISINLSAQSIDRVEPLHWWAGMENTQLQLLVYGENISDLTPEITNKTIVITKVHIAKSSPQPEDRPMDSARVC